MKKDEVGDTGITAGGKHKYRLEYSGAKTWKKKPYETPTGDNIEMYRR
jgi:hypothetical protein